MEKYKPEIEKMMTDFYNNLSEKDRRHYSVIEAIKLGYGGVKYIASLFKCSRQTIYTGLHELKENLFLSQGKSRRLGGGRKKYDLKYPEANKIFLKCN